MDARAEEAEGVQQRNDWLFPRLGNVDWHQQGNSDVELIRGKAEKTLDFLLGGEETKEKSGEFGFFPGRGKENREESVGGFWKQTTVAGQAGLGKEGNTVGFVEDGGDTGEVTIVNLLGRLQDREPDAIPAPFRIIQCPETGAPGRKGEVSIAAPEPFIESDQRIEAGATRACARKCLHAIGEFLERADFLVLGREVGQHEFAGGVDARGSRWVDLQP